MKLEKHEFSVDNYRNNVAVQDKESVFDKNPFIRTFSGVEFHFLDPDPDEILLVDIAHALSNNCRFTGHVSRHYSVGEHSIIASEVIEDQSLALEALLHDASEAYMVDMPKPMKQAFENILGITAFQDMEDNITNAIREKFGLPLGEMHPLVKEVDNRLCRTEIENLMPPAMIWLLGDYEAYPASVLKGLTPEEAKVCFIDRCVDLTGDVVV